jgi:hypothetical protein
MKLMSFVHPNERAPRDSSNLPVVWSITGLATAMPDHSGGGGLARRPERVWIVPYGYLRRLVYVA